LTSHVEKRRGATDTDAHNPHPKQWCVARCFRKNTVYLHRGEINETQKQNAANTNKIPLGGEEDVGGAVEEREKKNDRQVKKVEVNQNTKKN